MGPKEPQLVEPTDKSPVPIVVFSRQQDLVEAINSTLRNAGHAVHCTWIRELKDMSDALSQVNPQMLIAFVGAEPQEVTAIMQTRNQFTDDVPVIFVRDQVNEDIIATAMKGGARDVVTLANRARLQAVVSRELHSHRVERALNATVAAARESREQLKAFMAGSADAIVQVQEGIIVDANPAWLELFGLADADAIVGQPLMDSFDIEIHAALKGALVACLQGKLKDKSLKVPALLQDGSSAALEVEITPAEFDGDPAVRICVPAKRKDSREPDQQLSDAVERDATGLLQRRFFIDRLQAAVAQPIKGGVRQIVALEPDKFATIADDLGPLVIEQFVDEFAALVRDQLQPNELAGRFGDATVVLLLERGTRADVEAWAADVAKKVAAHVFKVGDKSLSCTCSIGIGLIDARTRDVGVALKDALQARGLAYNEGGNKSHVIDHIDDDTRQQANDRIWVKLIKTALMENRFRLMQQPIASLQGEDKGMFDVLVRMLNEQGQEVLPSEFIAAAERNDLMKNIDRWVIAAAMSVCGSRPVQRLFVRLSKDSVRDRSLQQWLGNQLKAARIEPQRIAFEVSEQVATEYTSETRDLAGVLRKAGFKFALEHFGNGREPIQLLERLPVDYIKVDGTLMQGLAVNHERQERVREIVESARSRQIGTIAERVEDANTMAILWQLGIEFIQGYFVNEPEQVTLG
jgi:diguanylate cyclase (GGDEF)-like protein/PAS domain S-box-containing protein